MYDEAIQRLLQTNEFSENNLKYQKIFNLIKKETEFPNKSNNFLLTAMVRDILLIESLYGKQYVT